MKASGKISGIAEGTLEAELADGPNIARLALSDLLRSFDHAERTLLLVLDEAIEPFERLGAEFVTAMTHKVNQLSRYPLSERLCGHLRL